MEEARCGYLSSDMARVFLFYNGDDSMTVVLCYTTDVLSLILSDKRVSYGRYAEFGFSDDYLKLVNLPEMGWAAGAGAGDYLDQLKETLANTEILSVADIMKVYQAVTTSFSSNSFYSEQDIKNSAVVASWIGYDEQTEFIKFRMGILSSDHIGKEGIASLNDNQIFTLYPIDYVEDTSKVSDVLNKYGEEHHFDGDLNALFEKVFSIFEEISRTSDFVTSTCDIGLQLLQNDGIYKIKFSGEISELLQEVKENRIYERYVLVSKIGS
jgi:hypothetical protein